MKTETIENEAGERIRVRRIRREGIAQLGIAENLGGPVLFVYERSGPPLMVDLDNDEAAFVAKTLARVVRQRAKGDR